MNQGPQPGELIHIVCGSAIWVSVEGGNILRHYTVTDDNEVFLYIETCTNGGMNYMKVLSRKGIAYPFRLNYRPCPE